MKSSRRGFLKLLAAAPAAPAIAPAIAEALPAGQLNLARARGFELKVDPFNLPPINFKVFTPNGRHAGWMTSHGEFIALANPAAFRARACDRWLRPVTLALDDPAASLDR